MIILSYGGGTNSTAMLVGLHERGEMPDAILFSDTGGERPETYAHVKAVDEWCSRNGFPSIVILRKGGLDETLEENCLRIKALPSLAYGFKKCSQKFKIQPQEKWANNDGRCKETWKKGKKVVSFIGFDADEEYRAKEYPSNKYIYRYPLIEWGWGRDECIEAIDRAGLCRPGKSSCFFCPSMKKHEVRAMAAKHPDLIARALAMEANAELTSVKGLGRSFSWGGLLATGDMFEEEYGGVEQACGCYDGD